ncbi:MAG: DUF1194 domain-containing protein [Rhizobiales bacterium]|nr:DUF1194 domain-containing protein [Hyphomicrobiales bacterium]
MRTLLAAMTLAMAALVMPARAEQPVAIELVLALDCSASVDSAEYALQLEGLAAAFRDPEVLAAIDGLKPLGTAIAVLQWGGPGESNLSVPWTEIAGARDAKAFAYLIGLTRRWHYASSTSIATAMRDGARIIEANAYDGQRKVIDISGDGEDNAGHDLGAVRQATLALGITINGLAVEGEDRGLAQYYEESVIGGPDAFVEKASDFEDFARAIKAKLLRELRPLQS